MVQDVVHGVKRDDFSAPQDKRKQDSGNRKQGAGPADVETVIVGGDIIKQHGKLVGEHIGRARELMLASRERVRAREAAAARG